MKLVLTFLICLVPTIASADICIIVSDSTKAVRRVVVPYSEAACAVAKGEMMLRATDAAANDLIGEVEKQTGVVPIEPRVAKIKDGKVVGILLADPTIDDLPGGISIGEDVVVGDDYDGQKFTGPDKTVRVNLLGRQKVERLP